MITIVIIIITKVRRLHSSQRLSCHRLWLAGPGRCSQWGLQLFILRGRLNPSWIVGGTLLFPVSLVSGCWDRWSSQKSKYQYKDPSWLLTRSWGEDQSGRINSSHSAIQEFARSDWMGLSGGAQTCQNNFPTCQFNFPTCPAKIIFPSAKIIFAPPKIIFTLAKIIFAPPKTIFPLDKIIFAPPKIICPLAKIIFAPHAKIVFHWPK